MQFIGIKNDYVYYIAVNFTIRNDIIDLDILRFYIFIQ